MIVSKLQLQAQLIHLYLFELYALAYGKELSNSMTNYVYEPAPNLKSVYCCIALLWNVQSQMCGHVEKLWTGKGHRGG